MLQEMIRRYQSGPIRAGPLVTLEYANPVYELSQLFKATNSFDPADDKNYFSKHDHIETFYGTGTVSGLKTFGINQAISYQLPITTMTNGVPTFKQWEPALVP